MTDGETKQMFAAMLEAKKLKTSEALGQLRDLVKEQYNTISEREANQMGWFIGQKIKMKPHLQNRKPYDTEGTIEKVNRTRLVVAFKGFPTYTVPKTCAMPVV